MRCFLLAWKDFWKNLNLEGRWGSEFQVESCPLNYLLRHQSKLPKKSPQKSRVKVHKNYCLAYRKWTLFRNNTNLQVRDFWCRKIDGLSTKSTVVVKRSLKLWKCIDKFLFPAKETYFVLPALELTGHGLPRFIEENWFCDTSTIWRFGNRSRCLGISPSSWLFAKLNTLRLILLSNVSGSLSEMLFPVKPTCKNLLGTSPLRWRPDKYK